MEQLWNPRHPILRQLSRRTPTPLIAGWVPRRLEACTKPQLHDAKAQVVPLRSAGVSRQRCTSGSRARKPTVCTSRSIAPARQLRAPDLTRARGADLRAPTAAPQMGTAPHLHLLGTPRSPTAGSDISRSPPPTLSVRPSSTSASSTGGSRGPAMVPSPSTTRRRTERELGARSASRRARSRGLASPPPGEG